MRVFLFALLAVAAVAVAECAEPVVGGQILVRNAMGKTVILDVDLNDTVATVKAKLEEKEGIPANIQEITFKRQPLDDEQTLASSGIEYDSLLEVSSWTRDA